MTSDITPSGVACTLGVTPRQLVQSSSENDRRGDKLRIENGGLLAGIGQNAQSAMQEGEASEANEDTGQEFPVNRR